MHYILINIVFDTVRTMWLPNYLPSKTPHPTPHLTPIPVVRPYNSDTCRESGARTFSICPDSTITELCDLRHLISLFSRFPFVKQQGNIRFHFPWVQQIGIGLVTRQILGPSQGILWPKILLKSTLLFMLPELIIFHSTLCLNYAFVV